MEKTQGFILTSLRLNKVSNKVAMCVVSSVIHVYRISLKKCYFFGKNQLENMSLYSESHVTRPIGSGILICPVCLGCVVLRKNAKCKFY